MDYKVILIRISVEIKYCHEDEVKLLTGCFCFPCFKCIVIVRWQGDPTFSGIDDWWTSLKLGVIESNCLLRREKENYCMFNSDFELDKWNLMSELIK